LSNKFSNKIDFPKKIESKNLSKVLYNLKERKLIRIIRKGDNISIVLTEVGRRRHLSYNIRDLNIKKPSIWDGKWRLVIFDIPEDKKLSRDGLRLKLKQLKFLQFQKSAWINPYPCEDEIDFLTENLGIGKYVTLFVIKIENDELFKAEFNL